MENAPQKWFLEQFSNPVNDNSWSLRLKDNNSIKWRGLPLIYCVTSASIMDHQKKIRWGYTKKVGNSPCEWGLGEKIQLISEKTKLQFLPVKQEADEDWVTPGCPLLLQSVLMPALSPELHSPRKPGAQSCLSVCWLLWLLALVLPRQVEYEWFIYTSSKVFNFLPH